MKNDVSTTALYLREMSLVNVGPVELIKLDLPFRENGTPKPLVLVGQNGTGKTMLLSIVADALIEFAKTLFNDVVKDQELKSYYFRLVSSTNRKSGAEYSLTTLRFANAESESAFFVEKTGVLEKPTYDETKEQFPNYEQEMFDWPTSGNYKHSEVTSPDHLKKTLLRNAVCFFPANRHERPHWLNENAAVDSLIFDPELRLSGLLQRPLIIESCAVENRRWIHQVVIDSLYDLQKDGEEFVFTIPEEVDERDLLFLSRMSVESILSAVLRRPNVKLWLHTRVGGNRIGLYEGKTFYLPSLENLSLGQSILFNLFVTIIRYADRENPFSSTNLSEIEGVVIVDEIDSHLHSDLLGETLPELISLFPKVQFIVSAHSPLFLLGMEKKLGSDGFVMVDMPSGNEITTERYSEFGRSFEYYRQTKMYEDSLAKALAVGSKPLVLTEGDTDPEYIKKALTVLGRSDLLEAVEIEWVGAHRTGASGPFFTGDKSLNQAADFIEANPSAVRNERIMLLYDWDTNKPAKTNGKVRIRYVPKNEGSEIKGIENLLPLSAFEDRFYVERKQPMGYGRDNTIVEIKKRELCDWFCATHGSPEDFSAFSCVVAILDDFVKEDL